MLDDTYLVDVAGVAVVEATVRRAAGAVDLVPQRLRGGLVDVLAAGQVVHVEEAVSEADVVDRVAVVVQKDVAVVAGVELDVDVSGEVRGVLGLVGAVVGQFHAGEESGYGVGVRGLDAGFDLAVGHPCEVARLAVEIAG